MNNNLFKNLITRSPLADTNFEEQTTFWQDFCIAEYYGEKSIQETFNNIFKEWKNDIKFMTELTLVLNYKEWKHHDNGNFKISKLYHDLCVKVDNWCTSNFTGNDLQYFLKNTD